MIKARAHKGDMRIDKTPKTLDSISCPQCRETKADTLKQLRPIGERDQEIQKRLV
jgi:4-hydroxy-3-methylbut-2-en-1-yl diphosphate synthase IspG/GcpE